MAKPVLQAMVLADHVYRDVSGKHIIAGTFSTIWFGKQVSNPVKNSDGADAQRVSSVSSMGSPYLYLALVELEQDVPLRVKYVELSGEEPTQIFEADLVVSASDPLSLAEFIIPMPRLPATKPGVFSVDIEHEGVNLGSWRVWVRELPQKGKKNE